MPVRSYDLAGTSLGPRLPDCSSALRTRTLRRPEGRCDVCTITGLATGDHVADLHLTHPLVSASASGPLEAETPMFSETCAAVTDRLDRTMTDLVRAGQGDLRDPQAYPTEFSGNPQRVHGCPPLSHRLMHSLRTRPLSGAATGPSYRPDCGVDDFVIARNPDTDSTLPFLVRLPLGPDGVVLKARDVWPRTAKLYCHAADGWPPDVELVERVGVRSCVRRGAAIDLVLDRSREARSMFVFTKARGRDVIFWQSARTAKQARPNVDLPTARAAGQHLVIAVDTHERYGWTFSHQQATTTKRALSVGDYAVESADGLVVGVVERKSLADFVATLTSGRLRYVMAALAAVPHAALVVEDRYSSLFKVDRVRPTVLAEGIAEAQVRFPSVPIVFAETRPLAQEWTYRFLGAALAHQGEHHQAGIGHVRKFVAAGPIALREPSIADVRAWARAVGIDVADKGRLRPDVRAAYESAHALS